MAFNFEKKGYKRSSHSICRKQGNYDLQVDDRFLSIPLMAVNAGTLLCGPAHGA
jgi:hypothetical protein